MVGQVMRPVEFVPPPVAETNARFAGTLSITTTFDAVDGPALVSVSVNRMLLPMIAADGPAMLAITSASGMTLVLTRDLRFEPLLLVGIGSSTGELACAMLRLEEAPVEIPPPL